MKLTKFMHIINNGYDILALGYYSYYKETVILITIQNSFFVKL